jgi:hypothetical protein
VQHGDRRVATGSSHREKKRERPANCQAATNDGDVFSLNGYLVGRQEFDNASGRARKRSRCTHDQSSQIRGMQTIDVLIGVNTYQHLFFIHATRQWKLHEDGVHVGICVEVINDGLDFLLRRGSWQMHVVRDNANLFALGEFHGHVLLARHIVANEQGAKTHDTSDGREASHAVG